MSFMAVAYIPSFLEDHATYVKDRANGLYGPAVFMLGNLIIGLPYLCTLPDDLKTSLSNDFISHNRSHIFRYHLLARKLPSNWQRVFYLDHVAFL